MAWIPMLCGCELVTEPLYATSPDSNVPPGPDSGPGAHDGGLDSAVDGSPCVDEDGDGACADRDCDDEDRAVSPDFVEFCPDFRDNDCDGLVDWADACDETNDRCETPYAILQQSDEERTVWQFAGLRLDTRYDDDYMASLSMAKSTCEAESGLGGGDAVFKIIARVPSDVVVTASGAAGDDPVLYLRRTCGANPVGDLCSDVSGAEEDLESVMRTNEELFLFVDENRDGPVDLTVLLRRQQE